MTAVSLRSFRKAAGSGLDAGSHTHDLGYLSSLSVTLTSSKYIPSSSDCATIPQEQRRFMELSDVHRGSALGTCLVGSAIETEPLGSEIMEGKEVTPELEGGKLFPREVDIQD